MKTEDKVFVVLFLLGIWFCLLLLVVNFNVSPGEGEKVGQIVKVSKVGLIRETWEAQLLRGGITGGSGTIGMSPFDFTISNDADAAKAQEYMRNQTEVVLKYRTEAIFSTLRSGSGGHFLVGIEPAKSEEKK